jgi:hypothetical protein
LPHKTIYIFSGLGVDHRVFESIDFGNNKAVYIHWISPLKNESISSYSQRLSSQIKESDAVFLGLSFGGIMAIEVSKIIPSSMIILLASVKTRDELPFYYRWAGRLNLQNMVPASVFKMSNILTNWLFGIEKKTDRIFLKQILADTDPLFLKWALNIIANWKNKETPGKITHIHGSKDRILPYRFVSCDMTIKDGGHFMTVNKAQEVSHALYKILS